jgi:hypothetical protein
VSHWFKFQSAVVPKALVYRRVTNASEILVGRVSGDAPESGRAKFVLVASNGAKCFVLSSSKSL